MSNNRKRALVLYHISNGVSVLFTGLIVIMIWLKSTIDLRTIIMDNKLLVIGIVAATAGLGALARRIDPVLKNPLFAHTKLAIFNIISISLFVIGVAMLNSKPHFIYVAFAGFILGMVAWFISLFVSRQEVKESTDHVLDDFDIEDSEKTD